MGLPSLHPLLLLLLTAAIFQSPHSSGIYAYSVFDTAHFNSIHHGNEAMSNAAAAKLSSDFIAAESSSSAASAVHPEEVQVWDVSDTEPEGEEEMEAEESEFEESELSYNSSIEGEIVPTSLDTLLDFAMQAFAHEVAKNKSSEIPVADFNKEFHARVGPFKVHGHFAASGGTAGDLTSLFRDGAVGVSSEPQGKLVLTGAAGLRMLRVRFQHYTARAGPIRVSGTMEAQVSPATVRAQLVLSPPCGVALRSLTIARVGPLRLQLTGLGVLKRLLPMIQRWIEKGVRKDVERLVVQHLSQLIRNEMSKVSCH